jgi:hypothetical protein
MDEKHKKLRSTRDLSATFLVRTATGGGQGRRSADKVTMRATRCR